MSELSVTGSISPDATGLYDEAGTYGGHAYYQRGTGSWFIWYYGGGGQGSAGWYLSDELGNLGVNSWKSETGELLGVYPAYGGMATGTATVAVYTIDLAWYAGLWPAADVLPPLESHESITLIEPVQITPPPLDWLPAWDDPEPPIFPPAECEVTIVSPLVFPVPDVSRPLDDPISFPLLETHDRDVDAFEPSLFVEPDTLALEWYRPFDDPTLFPLLETHDRDVFAFEPSLFVEPQPIMADEWYRPLDEPIPPNFLLEFPRTDETEYPWQLAVKPEPFLEDWYQPLEDPLPPPQIEMWAAALHEEEPPVFTQRYYASARGLYRIFNGAEYRFYATAGAPPEEGDAPYATSSSLPATPARTFADGDWWISCSWFNGVLDSGFLPLGPKGETWLRIKISGGQEVGNPPDGPIDWRLELRPNGVVRVHGIVYVYDEATGPEQWAIAYTTDASTPPEDTPDVTEALAGGLSLHVLQYDLPAQSHGTTVKVRLQTRRNDGTEESPSWVYSDDSVVKTVTADASGPSLPLDGESWPGAIPEE